jgi:hypothetical protein
MSERTPTKALGERINQQDRCRYDPNRSDNYAHPAKALAKGRGPEHRHPEGYETYRH